MASTMADQLLQGPRGRRLLFEHAVEFGPDELRIAAHYAGYHLNDDGISMWQINPDRTVTAAPTPPVVTPAEVADLLAPVAPPPVDEASVMDAFDLSICSARPWQSPDGTDMVLATAELRVALRPLADALARAPFVHWWATDCAVDDQHEVRFAESGPDESRFGLDDLLPPRRDFWWSAPSVLPMSVRGVNDRRWPPDLVEDHGGWTEAWVRTVDVADTARIFEVHSPEDWVHLCREYPNDVSDSTGLGWEAATGLSGTWLVPDWRSVASRFDGVHLSVIGYLSSATAPIDIEPGVRSIISGWEPDATAWLTDATRPTSEWIRWTRDDETGVWTEAPRLSPR